VANHPGSEPLTREEVVALLRTRRLGHELQFLPETTSTNSEAANLAQLGMEHGTVVLAERQTAGKGRLGRHWHSPAAGNLYCSVILHARTSPKQSCTWLSWIPLVSALATARAVQAVTGLQPAVKWPNDLLVGKRKLGGVLCESGMAGRQYFYVIVGIGLNVNAPRDTFPKDLQGVVTSLAIELGHAVDRASLLAALLFELEKRVDPLLTGEKDIPRDLLKEYTTLCSTLGEKVRVGLADGDSVEGMADSIMPDGALRIKRDQGSGGGLVDVRAGDVVHLR
jgi:BirA family biotin operon repressor/biotin-[acetyl-CoA-carboxylase] ligase